MATLKKFGSNSTKKSLRKFGGSSSAGGNKVGASSGATTSQRPRSRKPLPQSDLGATTTASSITPKYLPASIKTGDKLKVTWKYDPAYSKKTEGVFMGELMEVRTLSSGDWMNIKDNNNVWFFYPAYLCESIRKVR